MPTWLKVLLIVGGLLVVLLLAAVVGVFYVAKRYGPGLVEATKHSMEEGQAFGRNTDNEGCVSEVASRHQRDHGMGGVFNNTLFLNACLPASRGHRHTRPTHHPAAQQRTPPLSSPPLPSNSARRSA